MSTPMQLHQQALSASRELAGARRRYGAAALRQVISELLKILSDRPSIVAFGLTAEYEHDDEGGYFRWLSGSLILADEAPGQDIEHSWAERLDVEQGVLLELFAIENVGEGSLSREQLQALGAQDDVETTGGGR
jgi:hypothetical protein